MPCEPLPIDEFLPEITKFLSLEGAVVIKAEPGAGKTTRVPPAILEAGLAELGADRPGRIIVLQPRRVAARAAASRIADEHGSAVGDLIGYQVRFEKRSSRNTRILFCTEGVFLRLLQEDPFLETTAAVIFDEFHERSIDSDLALALVAQVRRVLRPDLKVIVMSATLDCAPICRYLDDCPSIECPGRSHPIDVQYLQYSPSGPIEQHVAAGIKRMFSDTPGDILGFLPGVGEIRRTKELLESGDLAGTLLMTLYGEMPLEEQQKVLQRSRERKIVLATNVAETSITINGITAVVDSGLARINRLDANLGLNRLQLERISKASANQRAGRAGRNCPGKALRLWMEREHLCLRDFEAPEIARVELSQCLLQVLFWGEQDLRSFPWFEAPPEEAVEQALQLLDRLDALEKGKLSELGKRMALLPLQPRLARLLLEGERLGCIGRAALCAALLSERDPFRRAERHREAIHQSNSDLLDRLSAIEEFASTGSRHSFAGEIMGGPARQILQASEQLLQLSGSKGRQKLSRQERKGPQLSCRNSSSQSLSEMEKGDEPILKAIMTAFPDRICRRREPKGRRAVMVGGRGVRLADESAVAETELFVAVELIDSGQSESLVRQASAIEIEWLPTTHLSAAVEVNYDPARRRVTALKRSRFCDLLLDERVTAVPAEVDAAALLVDSLGESDLSDLLDESTRHYLVRLNCLRQWLPELALPEIDEKSLRDLLKQWCSNCLSIDELRSQPILPQIQSLLTPMQISAIETEAPERLTIAGRKLKITYELDKPPVLSARIQELFGVQETPRIARSRVPVLLHLLAPNYRIQQITSDLAGFWKNTYEDVRKELKGRYPKHSWPENPLIK